MSLNLTNGKEMTPNIEYINLHITYIGCSELKRITKINKMFENWYWTILIEIRGNWANGLSFSKIPPPVLTPTIHNIKMSSV